MPEAQAVQFKATTSERVKLAIERLKERGALKDNTCPQCRTYDWEVGFIAIPVVPFPKGGLHIPPNTQLHVPPASAAFLVNPIDTDFKPLRELSRREDIFGI